MRRILFGILVFLGLILTLGQTSLPAQQKDVEKKKGTPKVNLPEGTKVEKDLEYGTHQRHKLDVYMPKSEKPLPLIVWVHGGGWANGSKDGGGPALRMLNFGYAVAAINYRLSGQATFPAQIEDCKAAIRYLRANAKKLNIDEKAIGVWGSSAGGHLVALLGTSGDVQELEGDGKHKDVSSRVQAVCDWFGPTDLTKMKEQSTVKSPIDHDSATSPESKLIGGPIQENKEKAAKANPITYVTKDDPPFLILHGDKDPLVPVGQSEILHEALKKASVDSTLIVVPNAGHGPGIGTEENFRKIREFFDKHLKR